MLEAKLRIERIPRVVKKSAYDQSLLSGFGGTSGFAEPGDKRYRGNPLLAKKEAGPP